MIRQGKRNFVVDLGACEGMDSTFLGILASAGIELSGFKDKGELTLIHLDEKNLDSVQSLGLDHLVNVDLNGETELEPCKYEMLGGETKTESVHAKIALDAHQSLIRVNKANSAKFEDVIKYIEERMDG